MPTTHPDSNTQLGIAEVEREVGILKDALRVWERRYGFPAPTRDARGDRLYDSAQVHRLQLIRRLLDAGHRPGRVVPLAQTELQELLTQAAAPKRRAAPPAAQTTNGIAHSQMNEWMDLIQSGQIDPLRAALRQYLLRHGLVNTVVELVGPLSHAVGLAWEQQHITVYQEHLFSEAVQNLLRESLASLDSTATAAARAPKVLLTTLPRELHGTGLLAAECFFALEGCQRVSLGPNTPLLDIVKACNETGAHILALSVSAHAPAREVADNLRWLVAHLPQPTALWVGGSNALLRSKRLPAGVQVLGSAQAIAAQISQWRAAAGSAISDR
ncbi:MAG: hypothetical protein RL323_1370 [Pseudomonadota bacterium]